MSSASKIVFIILMVVFWTRISIADDNNKDDWFGKDKLQHFTVSAFYSGGIAVVVNRHFDMSKDNSIIFGAGITISFGGAKEIYDHSRPGETSSLRDFIWDIGGALAGAAIAALII
jgi:putative lipoprotein